MWGFITGTVTEQTDLVTYLQSQFYLKAQVYNTSEADARYLRIAGDNDFTGDNTFSEPVIIDGMHIGAPFVGTSSSNTAVGLEAMKSMFAAPAAGNENNTAVGYSALADSTTGAVNNTAVGTNAGGNITSSGSNTCVGASAGASLTTGAGNTAVGAQANLWGTTGINNTSLGYLAGPSGATFDNTTALGQGAQATKSNQVVVGNASVTETQLRGNLVLDKTISLVAGGVVINKTSGSVLFGSGDTTITVSNSFAFAPISSSIGSIILVTMRTDDSTAVLKGAICTTNGSFNIVMKTAPTGNTRVDFLIIN